MTCEQRIVSLTEVEQEQLRWLWRPRIGLGMITLFEGDPGQAKSSVLYDLAARVTTGGPMPCCQEVAEPAGVVLLQAEDDIRSTVKPSLLAAGADVGKVFVYDRRQSPDRPLTLPEDTEVVAAAADEVQAKLVVIDPVNAFLSASVNADQSVRKALGPLAARAERNGFAVVLVRHLTKSSSANPLYRGGGSIALIAAARSALTAVSDLASDDPYRHVLVHTKANLVSAPSLAYRTVRRGECNVVEWLGECAYTARELLGVGRDEHSRLREGIEVLYCILRDGPLKAEEVKRKAAQSGVAQRTLERAKAALRVRSGRHQESRWTWWWEWRLPDGQSEMLDALAEKFGAAKGPAGPALARP